MATLEVCNLDQFIAMTTLKRGLHKNAFFFFVGKTYPWNFMEMLIRVEKYANVEKVYNIHLVTIEVKVTEKPDSSKKVPIEWGN